MNPDPFDLGRFISAQDPVIEEVLKQLRAGQKSSHWMWFVFPQIQGLGTSSMARRYAIASREEARAYQVHPVLGARLRQCTHLVLNIGRRSAEQIFGYPDDLKFRSCMTLFATAAPEEAMYREALQKYFAGEPDLRSLEIMGIWSDRESST
jgi:uncharacterized protein (DUF1810 family)